MKKTVAGGQRRGMSRMGRGTGSLALVLALAGTLNVEAGCSDSPRQSAAPTIQLGRVAMRLVTEVGGIAYRLSQAHFEFYGPSTITFGGPSAADAVVLQGTLPVGPYDVWLADGWVLERDQGAGFEPVTARLASENPLGIVVDPIQTALVAYEFETEVGRINFAVGDIAIQITVSDPEYCAVGGAHVPVDDYNPCTADACDGGRVVHTTLPDGTVCDDANACTGNGVCRTGACQAGATLPLPKLDVCGEAWCEPATGNIYRRRRADCAPRLELTGAPALTLDCDRSYTELGAVAQDAEDGLITVETPMPPLTSQPGTYSLEYFATDSAGHRAAAVRTVNVCGPACANRGQTFINFGCGPRDAELPCPGGWQVELLGRPSPIDVTRWRWNYNNDPSFRFVNQLGLGAAPVSVLRSNYDAVDSVLEGRMRAPDLNSHNYFGLSFGHRGPGDFYLFDWLGTDNGGSQPPGMSIKRVNAALAPGGQLGNSDFWGRQTSGPVQILEQEGRRFQNDIPYPYWVEIPFTLEVHANAVRLIVRDPNGAGNLVDWVVRGEALGGPVGVYSFQGPPTAFVGLNRRPLPAACAGFPPN